MKTKVITMSEHRKICETCKKEKKTTCPTKHQTSREFNVTLRINRQPLDFNVNFVTFTELEHELQSAELTLDLLCGQLAKLKKQKQGKELSDTDKTIDLINLAREEVQKYEQLKKESQSSDVIFHVESLSADYHSVHFYMTDINQKNRRKVLLDYLQKNNFLPLNSKIKLYWQ